MIPLTVSKIDTISLATAATKQIDAADIVLAKREGSVTQVYTSNNGGKKYYEVSETLAQISALLLLYDVQAPLVAVTPTYVGPAPFTDAILVNLDSAQVETSGGGSKIYLSVDGASDKKVITVSQTPAQLRELPQGSGGVFRRKKSLVLDGTAGNGATSGGGTVALFTLNDDEVITKLKVLKTGSGVTPDTGTPTVKFALASQGDITGTHTAEEINDNGVIEYAVTFLPSTADGRVVNMIVAGGDLSGTISVIAEVEDAA